MARYKMRKKKKRKKVVPIFRCQECRGVLEQAVDYGDTWKCEWCGLTTPTVKVDGRWSSPAGYWRVEGVVLEQKSPWLQPALKLKLT
jgi:hypothetical protein